MAKCAYWYEVLNYLRPFAIRKSRSAYANNYAMFQNYFKIGWRNLLRQKMYSSIKIGGFALGIAACFLITLFIRDELSYDTHFPQGDRIYRILGVLEGEQYKSVYFPAPFANALKEDYAEIEKTGRYNAGELFGAGSNEVRRSEKVENSHDEGFAYVDQSMLEILEVPMVYGNREKALNEPNTIVITERKSEKYFPGEDPVGKMLIINNDETKPYKIGGVIKDFLPTSHFQFDFLITMTGRQFWDGEQTTWRSSNYPTYILLKPGTDPEAFRKKMNKGVIEKYFLPSMLEAGQVDARELMSKAHMELQPVKQIYMESNVQDNLPHSDIRFIWLFGSIAAFILIIACINFINLSTAKSANRAKEVGLRKVVGSFRSSIINQFLMESLIFSVLSFALGILLAWVLLPYFNLLSAKVLLFPWKEWWLIPTVICSAFVVGILAGAYPSFYLSSFKPIQVLKGNLSRGSKNSGTRSFLVIFQFTTSIVLIVGTIIIYQQMEYILNKKVGYDKDQVLLIHGANTLGEEIKTFKNELLRLPEVKYASISDYLPVKGTKRNGNGFWKEGKVKEEKEVSVQIWRVDEDYIKTMGIKILEGRDFSNEIASDSQAVIINQTMARELGLKDAVGQRVQNWQVYSVIGVIEDFHFESLKQNIEPLALVVGHSPNIISVKVEASEMQGAIESISKVWKEFAPNQPIRYGFLDQAYARMYDDVKRMGRIFTSFAIFAIIVACLGLFALSAFMVEQRGKEISIRQVLGASVNSIFGLLTFNFMKLVLISLLIAIPISWYLMQEWLKDFAYKTEITWQAFLVAGIMAIIVAMATISYQSISAALSNPIKSLRSE